MESTQAVFPYKRMVVIGVTGSGKSILAEKLAQKLGLDFIELDALFWKPGWVESGAEEFRQKVELATRSPAWVIAGNYSKLRDLIWPRAQAVIWLDYPYLLVFGRLWKRTFRRWYKRELLWGTNYERILPQLKIWSNRSLFYWQVHSYRKHKKLYHELIISPENYHLQFFHFNHPQETERWLNSISVEDTRENQPCIGNDIISLNMSDLNSLGFALCQGSPHPQAIRGMELFNQGHYFEAHEALEAAWRQERPPLRDLYRGILQVGVVYLHITNHNYPGAIKVYQRCRKWLQPWPEICRGIQVGQLRRDLEEAILALQVLGPNRIANFDKTILKPIQFSIQEAK